LNSVDNIVILPALSFYEEENLFVNLEGKPQKTLKGINGPYLSKSIKKFFSNIITEKRILINLL
jgi:NADH dehydrogenase/NADH:ubiquinone oxidoreductase subunit G